MSGTMRVAEGRKRVWINGGRVRDRARSTNVLEILNDATSCSESPVLQPDKTRRPLRQILLVVAERC